MSLNPLSSVFDLGKVLIERLIADPKAKDEAKLKLLELEQNGELAHLTAETELMKSQIAVNVEEAKSTNLFVSGWRPFIGWVCGIAFLYTFILQPFIVYMSMLNGFTITPPSVDGWLLFNVLGGILGLGGLRTLEKFKGLSK